MLLVTTTFKRIEFIIITISAACIQKQSISYKQATDVITKKKGKINKFISLQLHFICINSRRCCIFLHCKCKCKQIHDACLCRFE